MPHGHPSSLDVTSRIIHALLVVAEPLSPTVARKLLREALVSGEIVFGQHARQEMAKDGLTMDDVKAILRGVVEPGELVNGTWRYRVRARAAYAVVAFWSETRVVVVTAWRLK